jgi:hypothetical protein
VSTAKRGCNVDGHYLEFRRIWGSHGVVEGWACNCEVYARRFTCKHAEKAAALFAAKGTSDLRQPRAAHG